MVPRDRFKFSKRIFHYFAFDHFGLWAQRLNRHSRHSLSKYVFSSLISREIGHFREQLPLRPRAQMRSTIRTFRNCAKIAKWLAKNAHPPMSILSLAKSSLCFPLKSFLRISDFRTKGAQKMTFDQFCQALKELSPKRFPKKTKEEAEEAIFKLVEDKKPGTNATTVCSY